MMRKNKSSLGVHVSHDASVCQLTDGKIDWFIEEERLTRTKHDEFPYMSLTQSDISENIRKIQMSSLYEPHNTKETELFYKTATILVKKNLNNKYQSKEFVNELEYESFTQHHVFHAACGFYNSGFTRSAVLVVDGMGNPVNDLDDYKDLHEVESIYSCSYPNLFYLHTQNYTPTYLSGMQKYDLTFGIGMVYNALSNYFGFGDFGSGKLMGLSAYGKPDKKIKPFLNPDGTLDTSLFYRTRYGIRLIPYNYIKYPESIKNFNSLEQDSKEAQIFCNLAYRLQEDFETYMINLIKKTLEITEENNIVLTGGCALNCVANYKYLEHLPKGVKLYVEPISTDAGTAIGLAKLDYYAATKSTTKHPLKTLYLGPER
jgi:carbamoyltransferase